MNIYIYIYINFRNSSVTYSIVTNWHNMKLYFEVTESKIWMFIIGSRHSLFEGLCVHRSNANTHTHDNSIPHQ